MPASLGAAYCQQLDPRGPLYYTDPPECTVQLTAGRPVGQLATGRRTGRERLLLLLLLRRRRASL